MKKLKLLSKTLLVAAALCIGATSAWAEETALAPVGVFTWTNAPAITYSAEATSWAINQGGVKGGKIGNNAGPYAIVKFDASSILAEKTLLTATLDFDITAGSYNSSINIAQMSDASFDPATVTTETFDATATQFQAGDWSAKNTTTSFSYDVKDRVAANNVLAFAIYTNTAREQTLKNIKLNLQYATGEVAKYNYSLKAVTSGGSEIKTLTSGEEYEINSVTAYFPYMFLNESTFYTTSKTPYSVTFDKDNTSEEVTYTEANSSIVAYMEGESSSANSGENAAYSNGKSGYVAGKKTQALTTLSRGKYTATIYLTGNPSRALVIRNTANSDVETNVIVSLPISKTSSNGLYTSAEFVITEDTGIGFSGYTTDNTTNQSADIDYIYITKTGDLPATVSAPITSSTGYATFSSTYALDFSAVTGLTAWKATACDGEKVTMEQITGTVKANTGLVIKGETSDIPVVADGDEQTDNLLFALDGSYPTLNPATDGSTNYVLSVQDDKAVFAPVTGAGAPNTAGHAALNVPASARALTIVFGDETTGIANVRSVSESVNGYYNLSGQRVSQPTKGLYIVDGKKVIVK